MSVVGIAWRAHPYFPLMLLYNRSEAHARPTAPARWQGDVLAGRDLQGGGSWLAASRHDARFAPVTGHQDGTPAPTDAPSRGSLPLALTEGIHTLSDIGLLDQKSPQGDRLGTLFGAYIKAAGGHVTLLDSYPKQGEPGGTVLETWQQDPAVFGAVTA